MDEASVEYARYVLDVRDGLELCNGRLEVAREYCERMRGELEKK